MLIFQDTHTQTDITLMRKVYNKTGRYYFLCTRLSKIKFGYLW